MTYHNAHAARIEDGIVREIIVIPYMDDDDAKITAYCNGIGLAGTWVDTSFIGARRKRYAAPGYHFDAARDEFVPSNWSLIDNEWCPPQLDETV